MFMGAMKLVLASQAKMSLVLFFFFFVSGLDFIGVEGANYPRKFDTAPGTIHPGAQTAPDTFPL